jgi:hypothetical protein
VWWRRPQPFRLPAAMDQAYQHFALSETATAFQGLYQALDAFWVNDAAWASSSGVSLRVSRQVSGKAMNCL